MPQVQSSFQAFVENLSWRNEKCVLGGIKKIRSMFASIDWIALITKSLSVAGLNELLPKEHVERERW